MFKQLILATLGVASLSLGACGTMPAPGNFNGLSNEPMSMVMVHKNPYYGPMTETQYKKVVVVANACLKDAKRQLSSVFETMATNGIADAAGGAAGEVLGVKGETAVLGETLVPGALPALAVLGAGANGAPGVVNGAKIKSGVVSNIVGNCANGDIHDDLVAPGMGGMHVYGSGVRTKNSSTHIPSWAVKGPTSNLPASSHEPQPQQDN